MTEVTLDGRRMKTREAAHAYIARKLALPDYYGNNLDALYDCLEEMCGVAITLRYSRAMKRRLGAYGESLCAMLLDAARGNDSIEVRLL